ncbi:hypothetical protein DYB25_013964 [Aphanomyces astaci]|uniref:Myb-like domain-containing protein n=1 Tax=Aphanomyces astaci TaxID=112090 RepID=A0A397BZ79_APHAT|nr:hypothetical protein DYB25_013964 [Aphanomyces astaci]
MNHPGNVREQLHMDKQQLQHLNSGHHNATDGTNSDHPGQLSSSQHPAHRHHHQRNQHQHQQSSSSLPSHVYSTSQTTWTAQELHLLHKGLTAFPSERYDSITRCIKVASTIPDKCIRDVACKIRSIHTSQAKQAMHHDQRAMSPMPQLSSSKRQKLDNNDLHMAPLTIKKEPVLSHEGAVRKGLQVLLLLLVLSF